jgi:hypothetical protein
MATSVEAAPSTSTSVRKGQDVIERDTGIDTDEV